MPMSLYTSIDSLQKFHTLISCDLCANNIPVSAELSTVWTAEIGLEVLVNAMNSELHLLSATVMASSGRCCLG